MINPTFLLQIKQRLDTFQNDHPKMVSFVKMVNKDVIKEGSVVEIRVTDPDGKEYVSNMRVNANDAETLRMLGSNLL